MLKFIARLSFQDDKRLHDNNVDKKVADFLKAVKDQVLLETAKQY